MKIIDLSTDFYTGLPVFPWDLEVSIEIIQTIEKDDWEMRRIEINSHDWTHVNVPAHAELWWKNLDDYILDDFIWESILFENIADIQFWFWIIFWEKKNISMEIAEEIVKIGPKFVWVSLEFDIEIEKYLLKHDIISFENLINTKKLPKRFFFHGAPMKIREWDWAPVRAYAIS